MIEPQHVKTRLGHRIEVYPAQADRIGKLRMRNRVEVEEQLANGWLVLTIGRTEFHLSPEGRLTEHRQLMRSEP